MVCAELDSGGLTTLILKAGSFMGLGSVPPAFSLTKGMGEESCTGPFGDLPTYLSGSVAAPNMLARFRPPGRSPTPIPRRDNCA